MNETRKINTKYKLFNHQCNIISKWNLKIIQDISSYSYSSWDGFNKCTYTTRHADAFWVHNGFLKIIIANIRFSNKLEIHRDDKLYKN